MIILKKKHEEILKQESDISYKKGFEEGKIIAIEELEDGFESQLKHYNDKNTKISAENARLTVLTSVLRKRIEEMDDALNKLNAIPCDDFDGHHHATQYGISEYWE